jgi:hypothetical protein
MDSSARFDSWITKLESFSNLPFGDDPEYLIRAVVAKAETLGRAVFPGSIKSISQAFDVSG